MDRAYSNFFAKRADFPCFKRKGCSDSFRYPEPKQIKLEQNNNRIYLPKLGWLRYRNSRKVLGALRNVTVSQSGGKWYLSIQTYREVEVSAPQATSAIGIDVGIARFATMNDATYIARLNSFKTHQQRLARYQRCMSRKVKFSSNWKKAKAKVQIFIKGLLMPEKISCTRPRQRLVKTTRSCVLKICRYGICPDRPKAIANSLERKCKQKSGLNRAILDQGWGEFRRQLDYKMAWTGRHIASCTTTANQSNLPLPVHMCKRESANPSTFVCSLWI